MTHGSHGYGWFTTGSVGTPKGRSRRSIAVPEPPYSKEQRLAIEKRRAAIGRGEYLEHAACSGE